MGSITDASAYDRVHAIINRLTAAARAKEQMDEHLKLVELIESDRHLLVGAKALATYLEQRFTDDTDYVVGHRLFLKARRWLKRENIQYEDSGETLRSKPLGINIIDAVHNPVLQEILKRETGIPSVEALAATKYITIVRGTRGQRKVYFDIGDLVGLVTLEGFDSETFLGYLVERYEEQRPHARELIDKIKRGESPITI